MAPLDTNPVFQCLGGGGGGGGGIESLMSTKVPDEYEISDKEFDSSCTEPHRFSQAELSDLVRDLKLSKESSEALASRLK